MSKSISLWRQAGMPDRVIIKFVDKNLIWEFILTYNKSKQSLIILISFYFIMCCLSGKYLYQSGVSWRHEQPKKNKVINILK